MAYTVKQVAEMLGYSTRQVYRLIERGAIQARLFGDVYQIDESEVAKLRALRDRYKRVPWSHFEKRK